MEQQIAMALQRDGYGPPAPVPIFQWEAEFSQLLGLYRERAPESVLEVGTYHGGTLFHWLQNSREGTVVVSLDSYAVGVDNRHLYADWLPPGVSLVMLEGDSTKPATAKRVAKHSPFEWVWIDAGHRYHEVKADWDLYRPMCEPGGIVCLHDILPASRNHPTIEVNRLWQEIQAEYATDEIVADRSAAWGGIGIVHV